MKATGWEKLWQNDEIAKSWAERPSIEEVVTMADRLKTAGRRRVLDIGCGMGRHTLYLAARGFEVTGTDNAPTAIRACGQSLAEAGFKAKLVECDMAELPFEEASFDGVIASHVIHHCKWEILERIIAKIYRLLAPDGIFVWVTPSPKHPECGQGIEIEPGTWVNENHREGPVPHHYCSEGEMRELLQDFETEILEERETVRSGRWHWYVLAKKINNAG